MKFYIFMTAALISQFSYGDQNDRGIEILTIKKDLVLTSTAKFRFIAKGKIVNSNSPEQMTTAYCAFENSNLETKTIKTGTVFDIKFKKVNLPNKKLIRYSLIEAPSNSLQIFCDFTKLENFSEKKLRASVNRQLGVWGRVTHH